MNEYVSVLSKYATFSGRARRREYWMFMLVHLVIVFVLSFIDAFLGFASEAANVGLLSGLYLLAVLVPSLAAGVRRLHDTGRSGWWMLVSLIPLVGGLVVLVLSLLDSEPGSNRWGPSPKPLPAFQPHA